MERFIAQERSDIIQERGVYGSPDLVVEVLSLGTVLYDRGVKFQVYDQAGVGEVWLIDPHGPADKFIPIHQALEAIEPA